MSTATIADDVASQLRRAQPGADNAEHKQLVRAVGALHESELRFCDMIDALPAAIYTTDASGRITHFNRACVDFSGRTPELGSDHWCVTWKLYHPDGRQMPHDQCPMAIALKTGQAVRGAEAIAERPDGTRIWFTPYPTPLFDQDGNIVGGINMLVDITDRKTNEAAGAYLAAIVESSDDAIITKSLDSMITTWNASAERLFGYTAQEAIGKSITMLIPPDRLNEEPQIIERLRRGERVNHFETKRVRKDGTLLDISLTISPVKDSTGRIVGASKVARDITERKRTEEALRETERRFRVMADTAPAMLWIADTAGACTFRSRGWYEYTGQTEANGLGSGWIDALHPSDRESAQQRLSDAIACREPFELDYRLWRVGNEFRWCIDAGRPQYDASGEFQGYIGSVIDVHERKLAEQNLQEADRRKDEFLATVAHELRNPLAPIRNSLHVLRMTGTEDPAVRDVHEVMERQVKHMVRLVDDLLEVSRIASGKIELRTEPIDLAAVLRSAVEISKPAIEAAGLRLTIAAPKEPVRVEGDGVRLSQVLANLLNNAAKFTERGGQIWLTLSSNGTAGEISVRDNGIGISADMLPRVFEMFTQVDRARKRSQGGLGIGLALAKRLVEMQGGKIEAKSAGEGQGSEFIVRLPLIHKERGAVRPGKIDSSNGNGSGKNRILVVDDNKDAAASLGTLLRKLGHDVQTATNGVAALEAMPLFRPSFVLLDLGMPGMSGFEVAQRARQLPECRDAVLIALTGWGQEEDRQRSREAGFDHHLVKPVDLDELGSLLQGLRRRSAESVP